MSTLLGPAVVLAAMVGILVITLSQPDQTATTTTPSRRGTTPARGGRTSSRRGRGARVEDPPAAVTSRSAPAPEPARRSSPGPGMLGGPVPAGFQWMDAVPAPRFRAGFALVVILAVVGALLAMAVAGVAVGLAVLVQRAFA